MNGNGRQYITNGKRFFGLSRSEKRAVNNLGINQGSVFGGLEGKHYRSKVLKQVDQYLNSTQYDGKRDWDDSCYDDESYVKLKDRKPKIIFPFAKVYRDRVSSKLVGASNFPKFQIEEDEETTFFINKVVIPNSFFKAKMLGVGKDLVLRTSAFCRFYFSEGKLRLQKYNSNYCYPTFDDAGELESVEIKYIYETDEVDEYTGKNIRRWYKEELTKTSEILFDNPVYDENSNSDPEFEIVEQVDHNFGFVQGEWFRIGDNNHSPDGEENPIIHQMMEFIDCLNYNLSQSDQAVNYGTEPQLAISGIDQEEAENLIKSATKTWVLGREGKADFIEVSGSGIESAKKQRDDYMKLFQDIARIVFLDPEKAIGSAQSGKAMEVLHGPLVELINEIRPWIEKGMKKMIEKIVVSIIMLKSMGIETDYLIPDGWIPESLNLMASWPPIFELTTQDKQQIVSLAIQVSNANLASRDTMLRWIQNQGVDFGIEDYELEAQKVNTQQQFNTWGGF